MPNQWDPWDAKPTPRWWSPKWSKKSLPMGSKPHTQSPRGSRPRSPVPKGAKKSKMSKEAQKSGKLKRMNGKQTYGTKGSYPNGSLIIQILIFDGASGTQIDFTGKKCSKNQNKLQLLPLLLLPNRPKRISKWFHAKTMIKVKSKQTNHTPNGEVWFKWSLKS